MDFKSLASSPLVLVLVGVLAWFGGRTSAPTKILEVEKHRDVSIDTNLSKATEASKEATVSDKKVDLTELKEILSKFAQNIQRDVVKKKTTTTAPDGTSTTVEESVDKSKSDTTASTDTKQKTDTQITESLKSLKESWKENLSLQEKVRVLESEKLRLVENLKIKDWGFGVTAAVALNIPDLRLVDTKSYTPYIPNQVVISTYLERRLIWNIYLQAWLNTRAELGLGARLGF